MGAHVIKFTVLEMEYGGTGKEKWERKVSEEMPNTVEYKAPVGPYIPTVAVVTQADGDLFKTYRYEVGPGAIVFVTGDVVQIPEASKTSESGNKI